jgi:hypothetical protein
MRLSHPRQEHINIFKPGLRPELWILIRLLDFNRVIRINFIFYIN